MGALAQNGLTYAEGEFDRERYHELQQIAAEMLAALADAPPAVLAPLLAAEAGYATPKVDVRAAVFHEGKLLLVREREDGRWTLPGGWADVGDTPGEAVAKEVLQESGFRVRPVKLLAVYDRERHGHPPLAWHVYKLFIRCELLGGTAAPSLETDAVGFFGENELPPLSLTRVLPAQLRRLFEHARHPHWPADFD